MKINLVILNIFLLSNLSFAQTSLNGKIIDRDSYDPAIFSTIWLYRNDTLIAKTQADFDGVYNITNLEIGTYDLEINYADFPVKIVKAIVVVSNKSNTVNVELSKQKYFQRIIAHGHPIPMIRQDDFTKGHIFKRQEIQNFAGSKNN